MAIMHLLFEIATMIQAGVILAAALIFHEMMIARQSEDKQRTTLEACARYELEESIVRASDRLDAALLGSRPDETDWKELRFAATIVLNFLSGIAIGVDQGVYNETLVKIRLGSTIDARVRDLLESGLRTKLDLDEKEFQPLIAMNEKWRGDAYRRPPADESDNSSDYGQALQAAGE